jgi:hypothetical protein
MKKLTATFLFVLTVGFSASPVFSGPALADRYHAPQPSFDRLVENFYRVLLDPRGKPKHIHQQKRWKRDREIFNGWRYAGPLPRRVSFRHGNKCHRVTKFKRMHRRGLKQVNAVACYNRYGRPYIAEGTRHIVDQFARRKFH